MKLMQQQWEQWKSNEKAMGKVWNEQWTTNEKTLRNNRKENKKYYQ